MAYQKKPPKTGSGNEKFWGPTLHIVQNEVNEDSLV